MIWFTVNETLPDPISDVDSWYPLAAQSGWFAALGSELLVTKPQPPGSQYRLTPAYWTAAARLKVTVSR